LSRDAYAAQDIVQDAFLRAFRSFEGFGAAIRAPGYSASSEIAITLGCSNASQDALEVPLDNGMPTGPGAMPRIRIGEESAETAMIRDTEAQQVRP